MFSFIVIKPLGIINDDGSNFDHFTSDNGKDQETWDIDLMLVDTLTAQESTLVVRI